MEACIGNGCYVTLHRKSTSIQELVKDHVELADKEKSDRHFCLCDLGDVISKYQQWIQLMPRVKPFYAVKCNDDYPVLKVLSDLEASFDCASKDEIDKVLGLDVSPDRIIYAQPCKQASMLSSAAQRGVEKMTFDNEAELYKVKKLHPAAKLVLRIMIVSEYKGLQDFNSKYGCHPREASDLLQTAKKLELHVIGVSFHVGSNCYDGRAFAAAIHQARNVFDIGNELGFRMKLLDIGGGFPGNLNTHKEFQEITTVVNKSLAIHFPNDQGVDIIAEPGRYMVASAFTLGVNVIAKRVMSSSLDLSNEGESTSCGTGMAEKVMYMYYVNDGVYGSFLSKLSVGRTYEPKSLKSVEDGACHESSIWGPSCDSVDLIVESTRLPLHEVGEWLYFQDMGAYTLASMTKFNGMEEPKRIYYCLADTWYNLYPEQCNSSGIIRG